MNDQLLSWILITRMFFFHNRGAVTVDRTHLKPVISWSSQKTRCEAQRFKKAIKRRTEKVTSEVVRICNILIFASIIQSWMCASTSHTWPDCQEHCIACVGFSEPVIVADTAQCTHTSGDVLLFTRIGRGLVLSTLPLHITGLLSVEQSNISL